MTSLTDQSSAWHLGSKALHETRRIRSHVEEQVDDADSVLESTVELRVFRVTRVVHVRELDPRLAKSVLVDVRAGGRTGKILARPRLPAEAHQPLGPVTGGLVVGAAGHAGLDPEQGADP